EEFDLPDRVEDLNMIGVRIGQLQNFIYDWSRYFTGAGLLLTSFSLIALSLSIINPQFIENLYLQGILYFDISQITFIQSESLLLYISPYNVYAMNDQLFYLGVLILGIIFYFAKDLSKLCSNGLFEFQLLNGLIQFPIVRIGIILIASFFLYNHYAGYPVALYPVFLCSTWFYFVFVKTKYERGAKEIVAILSAHGESNLYLDQRLLPQYDHDYLLIPCVSKTINHLDILYFNSEYMVKSHKIFGYVYRYDVQSRTDINIIKISKGKHFTRFEIGKWSFNSAYTIEELQNYFMTRAFKVEQAEMKDTWAETFLKTLSQNWISRLLSFSIVLLMICLVSSLSFQSNLILAFFAATLFMAYQLKFLLNIEWILVLFLVSYHSKVMDYRQSQNFSKKVYRSFKQFSKNYKTNEMNSSQIRTTYHSEKQSFTLSEESITYLQYENYLRLHPDHSFQEIPYFIHADTFREEALDILTWHMYQKDQDFSLEIYGKSFDEYCKKRGFGVDVKIGACSIVIDTTAMTKSELFYDILSYGNLQSLYNFKSIELVHAIKDNPNMYYMYSKVFKEVGRSFHMVKLLHLMELKEHPQKIYSCHKSLLNDPVFMADFLLILMKGKSTLSQENLQLVQKIYEQYVKKDSKFFSFWLKLKSISPLYDRMTQLLNYKESNHLKEIEQNNFNMKFEEVIHKTVFYPKEGHFLKQKECFYWALDI
ncbi:hypothetical protein MJH12_11645, partial [bacterium]|nr:hypothetical protein [bacterium]